jgi:hypothetical protein
MQNAAQTELNAQTQGTSKQLSLVLDLIKGIGRLVSMIRWFDRGNKER